MIALRPYQQDAVDAIYRWFGKSTGNPLVVVPTGGGKSVIIAAFVRSIMEQWPGERVLILTHVKELIAQNHAAMLRAWPTAPAGIYSAGLRRREADAPVLFGGIQSLHRKAREIGWADLILVDESHLIPRHGAGMYRRLIADLTSMNPKLKIVGFTATPMRTGEGRLDEGKDRMFHGVAYTCELAKLITDKYLSPIRAKATQHAINTADVHVRGGEFIESELQDAALKEGLVRASCAEIVERSVGRRSWLVFCCGIKHAEAVAECLRAEHSKRVATVFGDTKRDERDAMIVAYKAGEIDALVGVGVFSTGFDAPRTDLVVMLRPTMSPVLYRLDSKTEVLTSHGWRGMGSVAIGDCALSMSSDGRGCWSTVTGVVQRWMLPSESWVQYSAPRANFRVTDQHRIIFRSSHGQPWRFGSAADVSRMSEGVYMPTAVSIDQPGVPLTDAEIYIIGILMTDGSVSTHQATIYQSERHTFVIDNIERALASAGISYKKTRQKDLAGSYTQRFPRWRYTISAGDPREGRPGKGIRYLFPWLDKDFSPALFAMNKHQFMVLLDAMWDGDGTKKIGVDYTPRSKQICTARKSVADRMQSLAAMHAHTAHLRWEHTNRKKPIAYITFTDQEWRSVGGCGDRPKITMTAGTDEYVWCVETADGTIVTRRNGKVTVMGNCQMVGRGLRVADGKDDCLVLDFGGNFLRHGPIDDVKIKQPGEKDKEDSKPPLKVCGNEDCLAIVAIAAKVCPDCGFVFPEPERAKHESRPDEEAQYVAGLVHKQPIETWTLKQVHYEVWHSKDPAKPPTLRVNYFCGFNRTVSEWVCFSHPQGSFPYRNAMAWWMRRVVDDREACPQSVAGALQAAQTGHVRQPDRVKVDTRGQYPDLRAVMFDREPGEDDGPPPDRRVAKAVAEAAVDYTAIPF